jgi:hypothetical protein
VIIIGQVATADGASLRRSAQLSASGRGFTEHRDLYCAPAAEYRAAQPSYIGVDVDHEGRYVGQVLYLALRGRGLFAVLDVADDTVNTLPERFHLSAEFTGERRSNRFTDIQLDAVAIVERSASVGTDAARIVQGTIDDAHLHAVNDPHRKILAQAAAYDRQRRYRPAQPHLIDGAAPPRVVQGGRAPSDPPAHRSATGRSVLVGGQRLEIEHSVPVHDAVLAVR